jgi:hypothetical protein
MKHFRVWVSNLAQNKAARRDIVDLAGMRKVKPISKAFRPLTLWQNHLRMERKKLDRRWNMIFVV